MTIDILEDRAGTVFSEGMRDHLHKVFLESSMPVLQSPAMREFVQVEAASYWHRPGYGMQDAASRAFSIIHERHNQSTVFTPAEEVQLAMAHEAVFYMSQEL